MANALYRLQKKTQRDKQTAREYLEEMEALERDLPPLSDEERKAWAFLNGLRPDLRREVMRENRKATA